MAYDKEKLMNLEDGQEVIRSIDTKLGGDISNLKNALNGIGLGIEDGVLVIDPVTE